MKAFGFTQLKNNHLDGVNVRGELLYDKARNKKSSLPPNKASKVCTRLLEGTALTTTYLVTNVCCPG